MTFILEKCGFPCVKPDAVYSCDLKWCGLTVNT